MLYTIEINGREELRTTVAREAADYIAENMPEESYDDFLDSDGPVNVAGLQYNASEILQKVDPIAYRCGFSDYQDMVASDIEYDLEHMTAGDGCDWFGYWLEAAEETEAAAV